MNLVERVLSERLSGFIHPDLNLIRTERSRTDVPHVCRGAGKHQTMPKKHVFPCVLQHKLEKNSRTQNMFLVIMGQPATEVSFHLVE